MPHLMPGPNAPDAPATNYHPVLHNPVPDQLSLAVQACLHPEPHKRLTCQQLLGLPYFREAIRTFPMEVLKAQVRSAAWLTPHASLYLLGAVAAQALSELRTLAGGCDCPSDPPGQPLIGALLCKHCQCCSCWVGHPAGWHLPPG